MEKLREKLWPVVKEYTRRMKELMNASEVHWIGTDDDGTHGEYDVLDVNCCWFFSFGDVQMIIDNLDKWVNRYGSKEAVAEEIRNWFDWWLDDDDDSNSALSLWENRRERYLRMYPRIRLEAWLMGCPREKPEPTAYERLREAKAQREIISQMADTYRGSRSLWNIIENLTTDIKELERKVKEQNEQYLKAMKNSEAYKEFEKTINETKNNHANF